MLSRKNNYCVYFTIYSGQLLPPFYIGSTSITNIKNKNYRGSATSKKWKKIWRQELKTNPHLFQTKIVSFHNTRKEAFDAEEKYQRAEDVIKSNFYINESFANSNNYIVSEHRKNRTYEEIYGVETAKKLKKKRKSYMLSSKNAKRGAEPSKVHRNNQKISHKKQSKRILCVETKEIFNSIADAARKIEGIDKRSDELKSCCYISICAKHAYKKAYGYTWRFIDN